MKKVLVSLLVLALAMTSVFAAVNFSGEFVGGYAFNVNENGDFKAQIYGQDKENTNTAKFNVGFADEEGVWSGALESDLNADDRLLGDLTVDMMKLFDADSDISLSLGIAAMDEQAVLRAYSNQSGNNFDRIRTDEVGLWANVTVGYGDLVKVQVAGSPETEKPTEDTTVVGGGDVTISALVNPLDGLKISAGWVLKGDGQNGSGTDGAITAAADVNVASLVGLNFDLGASASYIYGFADAAAQEIAATVYGGVDLVSAYVEYAANITDAKTTHYLVAGADLNVVENMLLDVYFGSDDLENFGDTFFVGGDIGYTVKTVTFQIGLEYAAGAKGFNYENNGFTVAPSVKVAF